MIRVAPAPEPKNFNKLVRQPGSSALAELVGEAPTIKRPGKRRAPIAHKRDEIPPKSFPDYWTKAIKDLLEAYGRICAYVCCYIEPVTGMPTVDHMIAKSHRWDQVYEWRNYRLACSLMNSRKSNVAHVLDPFDVGNGWFELELVGYQLKPAGQLDPRTRDRVAKTIDQLKLNDEDCRELREHYASAYLTGEIRLSFLERRAPFIAIELRRQGKLHQGDA